MPPAAPTFLSRTIDRVWHLRGRTVLAILFVLFAMQVAWWWVPTRDGAAYLSIARGMAHGRLERFGSPHLYYAPGYPLLVSPLFLLGNRPFLALSLAQLVFTLLAAWLTMRWMRRIVGEPAPVLTLLVFVNVGLWALFRATLSELAFMALVMGTAECLRVVDERLSARRAWLGALLMALAVLTRQAGLTLVAGVVIVCAIERKRDPFPRVEPHRRGFALGGPAVVVFFLLLWRETETARAWGGLRPTYADQILGSSQGLVAQLLEGLRLRMAEVGRLLVPGMNKAYAPAHTWLHVNTLVYGAVAVAVGYGWVRAVRTRRDVLLWAAPFYVLLYVIWPFDQGTRFLAPLLPVWIVALWFALGASRRFVRWRRAVIVVLLLAHLGVAVGGWMRSLDARHEHDLWPTVDRVADRVRSLDARRQDALRLAMDTESPYGLPVRLRGVGRAPALMLQLALDRPLTADDATISHPYLVVLGAGEPPPATPAQLETIGPWRLALIP